MFARLKYRLCNTEEKKRLMSNIFSLSVLQAVNYILPLLTVPYLVRVLGPEYFGLLAFATATITYFMLITDYGFNLSATRQISIHRDNPEKINIIFSSVMIIKTALMVLSFGLMAFLVFSIDMLGQHWKVYFITFGMVVGNALFPVWLFQGMEKMKYITYLNVTAKGIFTACIFIFVQEKNDYLLVPFFTSTGFIITGLWSLYLVKKYFQIRLRYQSVQNIKDQLYDGLHIFLSSIAISLYTISTTFILGVFTNNIVVGYFAAADKIVQAAKGLYQPVSQAIYPLIANKLDNNLKAGIVFVRYVTIVVGIGMFAISLALFILAEPIVNLLLGKQYQESIVLLQIMAFLPFIIALSNIFGVQTMLNLGYEKAFSRIVLVAAITGISLSLLLVPVYQAFGIAITLLSVEIFVTIMMAIYLLRKLKGIYQ